MTWHLAAPLPRRSSSDDCGNTLTTGESISSAAPQTLRPLLKSRSAGGAVAAPLAASLGNYTAVTLNRSHKASSCAPLSFSDRSFFKPLRWKIA